MKIAPIPANEKERLDKLRDYQVLDTLPDSAFDDITFLASSVCKAPMALISLVDESRQWFKSKVGLEASQTPRDFAFCAHAILQNDVFVVPDSMKDERFSDNPLVTGPPHVRFYAGAPLQTPSGHRIGTLCVIDQVCRRLSSEQLKALQVLSRQVVSQLELRLQRESILRSVQLVKSCPAAIFCKDYVSGKGVFVEWNSAAEDLWGLKKEDVLGKTDYDFFPKEQADSFSKMDQETLETGSKIFIEQESIDVPKGHLKLRTWKVPVNDTNGTPRYLLGISMDITKQVALEKQLIEAKQHAESAANTKAAFLANMSHEIRTPMNGILGMANLLFGSLTGPSDIERVQVIQNCGNTLLDLINDILDFSKLEVDKIELEKKAFSLHATVREIVGLLSMRASEKGLILDYTADPTVPVWVRGDAMRFRQILTNLVSNAIKFTQAGRVHIFSSAQPAESNNWKIQFSVKDSGIGIPEHLKKRLFQSFSQVDASTTRRFGGSGLGLAISKGLVEKMGGSIWLESKVGKGSTFSFDFIAEESKPIEEAVILDPFAKLGRDMAMKYPLNILVAEDNSTNRMVAVGLLGKLGYTADVAVNGREVLLKLETKSYDLILMDCHMPEMDGFEATKQIRQMSAGKGHPRIIALSASTMSEDIDRCYASGMDGFLGKPVILDSLVKTLIECKSAPKKQVA